MGEQSRVRDSRPSLTHRMWSWGREARALARQGQLIIHARGRQPLAVSGDRVVVFVHGFMAAGPVFDPMRRFVEERVSGLGTVDLTYGPFDHFERVVDRLERTVENVSEGRPVDLVGHSLGGIVARWYLQERGGAEHVERLVTLATPHAGTEAARLDISPLLRAIHPEGRVIRRLREGRERASRVKHTAVVAGSDQFVTPPESAASLDGAVVHWFDELSHGELLFDLRVFEHVCEGLRR